MTRKVVFMLKTAAGSLQPSTAQDSMADCEHYCEERIVNYDDKKDAGAKVVAVELRELPDGGPAALPLAAAHRVASFLKQRAAARGLDPAEIATMNAGSEQEASLFTADLQALVEFVTRT
jgi:hypothetical protein